jgi:hypothetical protein
VFSIWIKSTVEVKSTARRLAGIASIHPPKATIAKTRAGHDFALARQTFEFLHELRIIHLSPRRLIFRCTQGTRDARKTDKTRHDLWDAKAREDRLLAERLTFASAMNRLDTAIQIDFAALPRRESRSRQPNKMPN